MIKKYKMPRHARVKYDTIFEVLKNMPIFTENGELKKQRDPVWKEACKIMPEINVHNLYLFVYQDRRQIKTNLMKHLNIVGVPPKNKKVKKKEPIEYYDDIWDNYDYYETLDNEDNQETIQTDFSSLINLKTKEEFKNSIHKIGILPFSVHYWHPQQVALWTDLINIESTVSFIALNNVISNITEYLETDNILLYALTVKLENSIILLAQMMSDSTKSSELQCFLNSWLETGAPAPQEIVIGYSYSMLDAASLAFNFSTFDNYNLRCYDYLINETSELPSTLIQIDVIGLIKVVDSWACFENILQPVKDFYLCSIMYLSTIDNLDIFRETIISILTMCQSPFQNKETESRRAALWVHLTTDTIQQMNQQYIQYVIGKNGTKSFSFLDIRQNAVIDDSCPHKIYDYINQLKMEAFEKCDFSMDLEKTPNDYYCPIVLENLIQLLIEFPSWTKIIKKSECSTLVSVCSTEHLSMLTEIVDPVHPSLFMVYHLDKIRSLMQLGKYFIKTTKDKNEFYKRDYKNKHTYLTQTISNNGSKLDNRIEINILNEKSEVNDEIELDLITFKNTILSTIHSLIDFDESVRNILRMQLNAEQETVICKIFLDCCAQMKTYEKFFGIIAGKFCSSSNAFTNAFGQIIIECYNTVELFDKNELKNISKLFAHLLLTDTISWEILSVLKLHEKELTSAKKNFIRILLRELSEHMGVTKLQEKFRKKINTPALQGLFPNNTTKNANYAILFFKSIGLRYLGDILKENMKGESSKLKRSTSNSSISSTTSSCDFIIEVRVSKKNGDKKQLKDEKKKIIVIK